MSFNILAVTSIIILSLVSGIVTYTRSGSILSSLLVSLIVIVSLFGLCTVIVKDSVGRTLNALDGKS